MGFRINTNVSSIHAQTSMKQVNRETEENFSKLSKGERIVKAADDAAGLAISERLKSQIRSSQQANRNANDSISLVQVAEGGLNESSVILTRMRELAIQASTDTLVDADRRNINLEYQGMKNELERIAQSTEFNGKKLLDGTGQKLNFQVGVGTDSLDDWISFDTAKYSAGVSAMGLAHQNISNKFSAQDSLQKLDNAFDRISGFRSEIGSIQSRLGISSKNLDIYSEGMSAANSRIRDLDYASEVANRARLSVLGDAGTAVMAQANVTGKNALKLVE